MSKIYVSGKITGLNMNDVQNKFYAADSILTKVGHKVMNPAILGLNEGFDYEDYMHVCLAMLDVCDTIFMLKDWQDSKGARYELQYAADRQKKILYEDEATREEGFPILYGHPKQATL